MSTTKMSGDFVEPEQNPAPLLPPVQVLGSSSDEEDFDLSTSAGRKQKRRQRRERIRSPEYLEFASALLKDPKRHKWATGFSVFFLLVHLIADVIIITALIGLSLLHSFVWKATGLFPATVAFCIGNVVIIFGGISILHIINRKRGIHESRAKLYLSCFSIGIGTVLELTLMIPFMMRDPNSITANESHANCIQLLDTELRVDTEEWTYDEEERLCSAFTNNRWSLIKGALATTFCCQIAWVIILFEFCCLVMNLFNPTPDVWATYREFRKHPTVEDEVRPTPSPVPTARRSTFFVEREISPIKVASKTTNSRYLDVPGSVHSGTRNSTTRNTNKKSTSSVFRL